MSDLEGWQEFRKGERVTPAAPKECCVCGDPCDGDIRFDDGSCLCETCADANEKLS